MFRRSFKLNSSSYFLQKFFFSFIQKPTIIPQPKDNSSTNQNINKSPFLNKNQFKLQVANNYEGITKDIDDRKAIYEIIKTFTVDSQPNHEFISKSFDKLQKYSFNAFDEKPGKLIHLLQKIAKQNLYSSPSLINERKKVAKRISNVCCDHFSLLQRLDVIMYLWIDVKLGLYNTSMIQKCLQYIEKNFSQLVEQDIINYLYSLARIIEYKGKLSESNSDNCIIQNHIERIRPQLVESLVNILSSSKNEQHLTNLIWSIDRIQLKEDRLLTACSKLFENSSVRFNNSNLARIINSFAHMQYTPQKLFKTLTLEFLNRIGSTSPTDFVSVIRAFYISHTVDLTEVLNQAEPYFNKNLENFSKDELVTLFLTYSVVTSNTEVINKLLEKILKSLPELSKEDLCRTFWSLAVLNDTEKLDTMLKVSTHVSAIKFQELSHVEIHRAAAGYLSLYLMYTKNNSGPNVDANKIQELKHNYEMLKKDILKNTLSMRYRTFSDKQGEFSVYRTFKALGLNIIPECITAIYNIDFALIGISKDKLLELEKKITEGNFSFQAPEEMNKEKEELVILDSNTDKSDIILIEIDGQYHFVGSSEVPKASTLLKAWHLEQLGYKLISITPKNLLEIYQMESEKERALGLINFIKEKL